LLHAILELEAKDAEIVYKSLNPDSLDWCRCFAKNGKFIIEVNAKKVGTILYTVDDYILNVKVSLEILSLIEKLTK